MEAKQLPMGVTQVRLDQLAQRIATDEHGEMPPHIMQEDDPTGPWADAYDAAMKMAWELIRLGYLTLEEGAHPELLK